MALTARAKVQEEAARLDAGAWTAAALEVLADHGIDGVRVELLARALGVTKGSFYWHFKDRDALHVAMLDHWRQRATLGLIERLDQDQDPRARLGRLMRLPVIGQRSARAADVELAIRLWGRRDPRAHAALAEVDRLRIEYITQLIAGCGVARESARSRAILAYAYIRVSSTLLTPADEPTMALCEALVTTP